MRICLVSREYPPETAWGGIGTYTHHLAHGLAERGQRVHVVAQGLSEGREEADGPVTVHRVCHRPTSLRGPFLRAWGLRLEYSCLVQKKLQEIMAREDLDLVEAPNFSAEGFVYSLRKRTPLVTRLHTHFSEVVHLSGWNRSLDHRFSCAVEDAAVLRSDLITVSTEAHRQTVASEIGLHAQRIKRIPLGIPLPSLTATHDGVDLPHPAVLFVGRLEKRKGVHTLFNAIPTVLGQYPTAHFVIVGRDTFDDGAGSALEGAPRNSWKERLLRELPQGLVDRVHMMGHVSAQQLGSYYRACDLFVAPSLYESFGLIYLEAMAYGKPVIGCSVGGVPEVVEDGVTGCLVPPEDPLRLAEAILTLLRNRTLRLELGQNARRAVETRFSRERMVDETLRAYQQLL